MCEPTIPYNGRIYTVKYEETLSVIPIQRWKASIVIDGEEDSVVGYGCTKDDAYFDLTQVIKDHIPY